MDKAKDRMKLQSSIEFLTVYGFSIAVISIVIVIIFYLATPYTNAIPNQCIGYGVLCSGSTYISNTMTNTANVILYLSNSGSSPANIISANVVINGRTYGPGPCFNASGSVSTAYSGNNFVVPGGPVTCIIAVNPSSGIGAVVRGEFTIDSYTCNSAIQQFSAANCLFVPSGESGTFSSASQESSAIYYHVTVADSPAGWGYEGVSDSQTGYTCGQPNQLCTYDIAAGTVITINAYDIVNSNHIFSRWECTGACGGYSGTSSSATFTLNGDITETAVFVESS